MSTPLVYILKCDNEFFKIGYTKGCVNKRISSCQTGNPYEITLHGYYFATNAVSLESYLHKAFKNNRVMGEWFKLDDEKVKEIPEVVHRYRQKFPHF